LDRPANARAVAVRLGLADHEIIGLALGLAQVVYGESMLDEGNLGLDDLPPQEPPRTMAVDRAALLAD
jgi:eukaryotic-like serine/threonine-protein kinase